MSSAILSPEEREQKLYRRFAELGIKAETHPHAPVYTVEEARTLRGALSGCHTKNLFLRDKKRSLWLVVLREDLRVDLNALSRILGAPRFSFASSDLLAEVLGVPPGAVTPFALINDADRVVHVVLDEDMLRFDPLNFHPLRNDRTTAIAAEDLLKLIRACGHQAVVAKLPELPA